MKLHQTILVLACIFLTACSNKNSGSYERSTTTGWEYNNPRNGGFETNFNYKFTEQKTGPGLVFVEGGTFTMGRVEADVMTEWNNVFFFSIHYVYINKTYCIINIMAI